MAEPFLPNKQISVAQTWHLTWLLLKNTRKSVVPLCLFLVFLPAMTMKVFLALRSIPSCSAIKGFTSAATTLASAPNYYELFAIFSSFIFYYLGGLLLVALPTIVAFFGISKVAIAQQVGQKLPSFGKSMREGVALFLHRGLVVPLFFAVLIMEQIFLGPFHVFSTFALVAPILIINEKQGVFASLKNSLLFKYCAPQTGGPFLSAFVLMALSIMIYVGETILYLLFSFILSADEFINVPRFWWLSKLPGLPFSLVYALADCIFTAGYIFLGVFALLFVISLFFQVRLKISERF